jgi:hypothetical protein
MLINSYRYANAASLESQALAIFAGGLGAGGLQGLMLDLSKASSLYTDSTRTTLVSAAGDAIGSPSDLSPNANHPLQATSTKRPLWQTTYADFDGVDDVWATPVIDFSGTDAVTVVTAFRKTSDATTALLYEYGNVSSNAGSFGCFTSVGGAPIQSFARGSLGQSVSTAGFASPVTVVHTLQQDISAPLLRQRINGGSWTTNTGTQGTGSLGSSYAFTIGLRGSSLQYKGGFYRQFVIGKQLSDAELAIAEAWANETVLVLP